MWNDDGAPRTDPERDMPPQVLRCPVKDAELFPTSARPRAERDLRANGVTNVASTVPTGPAERLGLKSGMVIQELGWDNDTDDELRAAIEDAVDADLVDGDYGNDVDAVLLWWRDEDGDLVDGLVDALTDLIGGGAIWLLTPKVGRPGAVDPADIAEAAPLAGLSQTTTATVSKDWAATRLVAPKSL